MLHLVTCIALLSMITDIAHGTLSELPKGLTVHKGSVTWYEAHDQCQREGRVLASPVNTTTLTAMKSVIDVHNITYFIGTKATDLPGRFVSVEGVALEYMPLTVILDMVQQLDQREGDCLAMSRNDIRAVPCRSKLPYMCYGIHPTNCGPDEEGYKYDITTGHCYNMHRHPLTWEQAHWTCLSEGGHLAVVETKEEMQVVRDMEYYEYSYHFFIGRRKMVGRSGWMSIFGQPVEELYNVWSGNRTATDDKFECGGLNGLGELQAIECEERLYFICQKEPTI